MKKHISFVIIFSLLLSSLAFPAFSSSQALPFTDVSETKWYYDEISAVYEAGVMEGKSEKSFDPDAQ